ncbi:MAG: copper chaperone PCu(A)C [Pseudomonadota bacterium]
MIRTFALCFALAATPALAGDDHNHDHSHGEAEHLAELEGLRVLHVWAVPGEGAMQIYMEVENESDAAVTLTGGELHDGAELVLYATEVNASGGAVAIGEIEIAPETEMDLAPDGLYLVAEAAPEVSVGEIIEAHLEFAPLGELEVEIEIFAPGTRTHPHAGHNH